MNPTTTSNAAVLAKNDVINPVLAQLKQEAEEEVKRLRAELVAVREEFLSHQRIEEQAEKAEAQFRGSKAQELRNKLPSSVDRNALLEKQSRLEGELKKAEQRLELELTTIRQSEVTAASAGGRLSRANRELTELLEAATRVLPEYSDKLDRLVQSTLTIWDRRDVQSNNLAPLFKTALSRLGDEFLGLSEPLRQWINKLSAVHEEGRLTDVQRLELRLRLTELEVKFQTAEQLLKQLNVL